MSQQDAFIEELYCIYLPALQRFCIQYLLSWPRCLSYADDYVQDTFIKALKCQNQLKLHPNPYGWLIVACKNICNTEIRKDMRRCKITGIPISLDNQIEIPNPKDDTLCWLCQEEDRQQIKMLVAKLTPQEFTVTDVYFIEHLSLKETAKRNEMSPTVAQGALQRIRHKAHRIIFTTIFSWDSLICCFSALHKWGGKFDEWRCSVMCRSNT